MIEWPMDRYTASETMTDDSTIGKFLNRLIKFGKYLVFAILGLLFLAMSIFSWTIGRSPVEGDTYSTPLTNIIGTTVILFIGLFAWLRSKKKSDIPDPFASWLRSKAEQRETRNEK
jgi:hypothetical protein